MKALLRDALRGLRQRRGATAVALGGLMLAQAACLLWAVLAFALAAVDPAIPDPERVVLLDFKGNIPGREGPWFTAAPVAFGPMLKERQLPLDLVSRVAFGGIDFPHQGRIQPAYLLMADADAVPLLGLRALAGDLRAALTRRDGIAITTGLVRQLWGDLPPAQALGRTLPARGLVFTVAAVIPNTHPRAPFWEPNPMVGDAMAMVGFESQGNDWSDEDRRAIFVANGRIFARLKPGASAAQVGGWMREAFVASPLHARLPAEWRSGREAAFFRGLPLTELPFEGELNQLRWLLLGALAAACALLLLLAAFNAMNLQTANLLQRQRETALRRALGADGRQLLALWAMELLLPLLLAAGGALLLAWWLAPTVALAIGLSPQQPVADPLPWPALAGLALAVVVLLPLLLALPAAAALRRAPAPALQGRTASEGPGSRRVRPGLLTLQMGGALLLLALAGVLAVQQHHLLHADQGFHTRNRLWMGLMVNPEALPNVDALAAALSRHPAIRHWAYSSAAPARETQGRSELHVSESRHQLVLRITTVSPGFFDTYGMTLLAGSPRVGQGEQTVVIDANAAQRLGFASPQAALGALLRGGGEVLQPGTAQRRVVAVVKSVKLESAREPAMPQAFVLSEQPQWDISVFGPDMGALRQALDEIWKAHGPPVPHQVQSADAQRADIYRQEEVITSLLAAVAVLAVAVAMLGAYALVADTLRRRRTELVLHRLHGAGDAAIARQVAREFAPPLLVAACAGLPLAAWLGQLYRDGFVDRAGAGPGLAAPLAAAALLTLLATAIAAWRHLRLALALQPAQALQ